MWFLYLPKSFLFSIPCAVGMGDNMSPYTNEETEERGGQ